jgi:uncharacterized protein YqfA (UPF0365 family)
VSYCPQCASYEKKIAALEKEKAEAVLAEREMCAKTAERHSAVCHGITHGDCAESIAAAIREGRE